MLTEGGNCILKQSEEFIELELFNLRVMIKRHVSRLSTCLALPGLFCTRACLASLICLACVPYVLFTFFLKS